MEQHPATRATHGRNARQRRAAPCPPMETPWEQAALQRCRIDPCRNRDNDLGIGGANRLRCRPRPTLRAHFNRTLRHQPQPDVRRLDPALSRSCACHAKRVDARITPDSGRDHPPGGYSRGAYAGASIRRRVHSVPEAGSSISLTVGAELPRVNLPCRYYSMRKPEAGLAPHSDFATPIQRRPADLAKPYKTGDHVLRSLAALLHGSLTILW